MESSLEELNVNSEVIKFRKDFLSKYLVKLVTAEVRNLPIIPYEKK